jgi:hypothetical protein
LRLWNDPKLAVQLNRLFAIGVQAVKEETKNVWLLEMYCENMGQPIQVQNYGIFATAQRVHKFMLDKFPEAVQNEDDSELGYIGWHFPAGHLLENVSFVANAWDLQ